MVIPQKVLDEICAELEREYPHEGCGLLIGAVKDEVHVLRQIPVFNHHRKDAAASRRYLISAEDYLHATQAANAEGLEVVGAYHSHPDRAPQPSAYDEEYAWPRLHYLIVSVVDGTAKEMRAWQRSDDRVGLVERGVEVQGECL